MVQTLEEEDRRASDGDSGRVTSNIVLGALGMIICFLIVFLFWPKPKGKQFHLNRALSAVKKAELAPRDQAIHLKKALSELKKGGFK